MQSRGVYRARPTKNSLAGVSSLPFRRAFPCQSVLYANLTWLPAGRLPSGVPGIVPLYSKHLSSATTHTARQLNLGYSDYQSVHVHLGRTPHADCHKARRVPSLRKLLNTSRSTDPAVYVLQPSEQRTHQIIYWACECAFYRPSEQKWRLNPVIYNERLSSGTG